MAVELLSIESHTLQTHILARMDPSTKIQFGKSPSHTPGSSTQYTTLVMVMTLVVRNPTATVEGPCTGSQAADSRPLSISLCFELTY